jgi:hypothetical protein
MLALQKKTGEYTILQTFSIARLVELDTSSAQRQDKPNAIRAHFLDKKEHRK